MAAPEVVNCEVASPEKRLNARLGTQETGPSRVTGTQRGVTPGPEARKTEGVPRPPKPDLLFKLCRLL